MIVDSTNPRIMADNIRELAKNGGGGSDLPDVDIGDAGKVLMVGDTGEWEADDLPPQLPEVDQSDAGKVPTVGNTGEWEVSDPIIKKHTVVTKSASTTDAAITVDGVDYSYQGSFPVVLEDLTVNYDRINFKWSITSSKNCITAGTVTNQLNDVWNYNETVNKTYYILN